MFSHKKGRDARKHAKSKEPCKMTNTGVGETAHQLRAPRDLAEDLSLVPRTQFRWLTAP